MSLRSNFGNQGCKRFGDDKESTSSVDKKTRAVVAEAESDLRMIATDTIAELKRENKALRQQVAELTMKLSGTKNKTGVTKISVTDNKNDATKNQTRKRGPKPKLTPEQKRGKTAARVAAWRAKNPTATS